MKQVFYVKSLFKVVRNVAKSLLVCIAFWMIPSIAKADTPIPTGIVSNYDAALHKLTLTITWSWPSAANNKYVTAAVFADLNGDGIAPTFLDNPATYTSGGNAFTGGLLPRDEFLGQLAISTIEGSATSAMFPALIDNTDNGIAFQNGFGPTDPRVLFPYGTTNANTVGTSGTFTMTFTNVTVAPSKICVVMYDVHSGNLSSTGNHSPRSANPNHNGDNSVEDGNSGGVVTCTGLVSLQCAVNKTEASCQTQAAINSSYAAWIASVTASGCNGVLTNNSTGAPLACGGSKTVTFTYTQNGCPNQAPVTTCTATFTVTADLTPPVFTNCPAGANLGCNPSGVPPASTATATDNCANSTVTITNSLGPVIVNGTQRTQTRTYTAIDACGNSSTCQQVFTWSICPVLNPDINVTFVNVSVCGNTSTNDGVPAGTLYGTPTAIAGNPAGGSITVNPDGTYCFISPNVGVYKYNVPVCIPGQVAPCPNSLLTITVLSPNVNNPPVANTDIATTKVGVPVVINSLLNDKAGNPGGSLNPASVTVTVAPLHGGTSVNPATGAVTYTPAAGYTGMDTLTYRVCDNTAPTPLCATALQIITIKPAVADNSTAAADDYNSTMVNTPVSGNVKTNDTDPEGNTQTVTAQTTTVAGKGTLALATTGTYTFTPVTGFTGPVSYVYTTCDNGAPVACANATLYILVMADVTYTNPDFNSTYVNVPVPGNVSTNDKVPAGTNYGTPILASSPAGSLPSIILNSNGTYSFVSNLPGVYTYDVPVCMPGQVAPCPPTKLVITVLDATVNTNPPVANVDIATTNINTPVTLKTLANDAAGSLTTALVPSSVAVTIAPLHGSTSINPVTGDNTYTPALGFSGVDTLTYQVCDNQAPAKCATAKQIITVKPAGGNNTTTAADDYKITSVNTPATGNVKTNDSDAEGNTQTVTTQTTTVPGKGTVVLLADGSYTFTPVTGYTGPVDFPYTTCDNGVPQACASATLHILVRPEPPYTNPDFNSTFVNVAVPGDVSTNDKVPAGTTYGTTPTLASSPAGSTPTLTMNSNGTYIFISNLPGVYTYDVPVCIPGQVAPCPVTKLVITVLDANLNSNPPVANVDIAVTNMNTAVVIKTLVNDAAGSIITSLVPSSVTVTVPPLHGTTSINLLNGDNTYTPAAGYVGTDTLTYQVCDNQIPSKCATAKQVITVRASGAANTTSAADDYKVSQVNAVATGNVKTNDTDPEGNTQTVAPQTTNIAGKGTLVLLADGSYTFTPQTNYIGPVDYPYTTCDNGIPSACASATLHILVKPLVPVPDLTPNITAIPNIMHGTTVFNVTVRITEVLGVPTNGSEILVRIPKDVRLTFTYNPAATQIGFTPVNNNVWTYDNSDPFFHIFKTSSVIPANGASTFGFVSTFVPGQSRGKYTLTSSLNSGSGGEIINVNNNDAEVLDYFID